MVGCHPSHRRTGTLQSRLITTTLPSAPRTASMAVCHRTQGTLLRCHPRLQTTAWMSRRASRVKAIKRAMIGWELSTHRVYVPPHPATTTPSLHCHLRVRGNTSAHAPRVLTSIALRLQRRSQRMCPMVTRSQIAKNPQDPRSLMSLPLFNRPRTRLSLPPHYHRSGSP